MLYMLVLCSGAICIPAEPGGGYTLSETECEFRVVQMRDQGDMRCYLEAWGNGSGSLRDPEGAIEIAPPDH
jgi:hypothetical protein